MCCQHCFVFEVGVAEGLAARLSAPLPVCRTCALTHTHKRRHTHTHNITQKNERDQSRVDSLSSLFVPGCGPNRTGAAIGCHHLPTHCCCFVLENTLTHTLGRCTPWVRVMQHRAAAAAACAAAAQCVRCCCTGGRRGGCARAWCSLAISPERRSGVAFLYNYSNTLFIWSIGSNTRGVHIA
jgi:hypothetical protein